MEMFIFLWTCVFLPLIRGHSLFTCEPIIVPRCMKMAYNMTFFPNLMGHYDQSTAAVEMEVSSYSYLYRKIVYALFYTTLWMQIVVVVEDKDSFSCVQIIFGINSLKIIFPFELTFCVHLWPCLVDLLKIKFILHEI